MHQVGRQLGGFGFAVQLAQQLLGSLGFFGAAKHLELVAAVADFQAEALFDQAQMLVELAAEVGETAGLERFEGEAMRF